MSSRSVLKTTGQEKQATKLAQRYMEEQTKKHEAGSMTEDEMNQHLAHMKLVDEGKLYPVPANRISVRAKFRQVGMSILPPSLRKKSTDSDDLSVIQTPTSPIGQPTSPLSPLPPVAPLKLVTSFSPSSPTVAQPVQKLSNSAAVLSHTRKDLKRWKGPDFPRAHDIALAHDTEMWDGIGDVLIWRGDRKDVTNSAPVFRILSTDLLKVDSSFWRKKLQEGFHNTQDLVKYSVNLTDPDHKNMVDYLRILAVDRNALAVILERKVSLVGFSLWDLLMQTWKRLNDILETSSSSQNALRIVQHINKIGIDDVSNNPERACVLLAFYELPQVQYTQGYRTCFVHCVGMWSKVKELQQFQLISQATRDNLKFAGTTLAVRIADAEISLGRFRFDKIEKQFRHTVQNEGVISGYKEMSKFMVSFSTIYTGTEVWPASDPKKQNSWLTRQLAKRMEADLKALYVFLVDEDSMWDVDTKRPSDKYQLFTCNDIEKTIGDIKFLYKETLIDFDRMYGYKPMPHPGFHIPPALAELEGVIGKPLSKSAMTQTTRPRWETSYFEHSNFNKTFCNDYRHNALVEKFRKMEQQSAATSYFDAHDLRRGR